MWLSSWDGLGSLWHGGRRGALWSLGDPLVGSGPGILEGCQGSLCSTPTGLTLCSRTKSLVPGSNDLEHVQLFPSKAQMTLFQLSLGKHTVTHPRLGEGGRGRGGLSVALQSRQHPALSQRVQDQRSEFPSLSPAFSLNSLPPFPSSPPPHSSWAAGSAWCF